MSPCQAERSHTFVLVLGAVPAPHRLCAASGQARGRRAGVGRDRGATADGGGRLPKPHPQSEVGYGVPRPMQGGPTGFNMGSVLLLFSSVIHNMSLTTFSYLKSCWAIPVGAHEEAGLPLVWVEGLHYWMDQSFCTQFKSHPFKHTEHCHGLFTPSDILAGKPSPRRRTSRNGPFRRWRRNTWIASDNALLLHSMMEFAGIGRNFLM